MEKLSSMEIAEYKITGMHCAACAAAIERAMRRTPGVETGSVNLATERLRVRGTGFTDETILAAVDKAGFSASRITDLRTQSQQDRIAQKRALALQTRQAIVAIAFAIPLFYLSMGPMIGLPSPISMHDKPLLYACVQVLLLIPILIAGRRFYISGFKALFHGSPNMDTLVAVGTIASIAYSLASLIRIVNGDAAAAHDMYWESAGVIIALVMLGKLFEARSKRKTSDAVDRMMRLTPETATVLSPDGTERKIPVTQLMVGDSIRVHPGERVPTDGRITEGVAHLDESMLTGESMPVDKLAGDPVTGGSINGNTAFTFSATRVGNDTTLADMIRLVEEAQGSKAPISRLADKISGIFVPVVFGIAILAAVIWAVAGKDIGFILKVFVSVLVIACPCALGLATPTAIMVGTGAAAERGILIKSGEALETVHALRAVAFDKTGTLTIGKPTVTDVCPVDGNERDFLQLFASGEQGSEHPIGSAIVRYAGGQGIAILPSTEFAAVSGFGATATVGGKHLSMGNAAFLGDAASAIPIATLALSNEGKSVVHLSVDGRYAGSVAVADTIRADSAHAVGLLRKSGIHTALITGDNSETAAAIARQAGIENVLSQVTPEKKAEAVKTLQAQFGKVAMVGDGVNDAPALATADVGIAAGSGTDVAISGADIVLMQERLDCVTEAIAISNLTMRIIRMNLFWAFFYNCVGIPIAAGVLYAFGGPLLSPMIAALAMSLSSVTVVTNALSLKPRCRREMQKIYRT